MVRIVFTLCSNNYLAQAKTLGNSLQKTNPTIKFIIGLTDKPSQKIDYSFLDPFEILNYDKLEFHVFEEMSRRYNIIEFNTSVKPFYFEYLFTVYGRDSLIYYLDPDLFVYGSLEELHTLLRDHNFLITPHILRPELTITPHETIFTNVGIYNLGFMGMRWSENTLLFLKWWQNRVKDHCYINFNDGLFVDQIWVNFIHLLFEKVHILRSPGYNMAYWNFYERKLIQVDGVYYVNDNRYPLVFFHFSAFNPETPSRLARDWRTNFTDQSRPDLAELYLDYASLLQSNRYDLFSKIQPALNFRSSVGQRIVKPVKPRTFSQRIKKQVKDYIKAIFNI